MGVTGTGSLEHGDASGEIFWVHYPFPFLTYYYATYPDSTPRRSPRCSTCPSRLPSTDREEWQSTHIFMNTLS